MHKSPGKNFLGNFFSKIPKKKISEFFSQKIFEKNRSDFFRPAAAEISGKKLGEIVGQKIRHKKVREKNVRRKIRKKFKFFFRKIFFSKKS